MFINRTLQICKMIYQLAKYQRYQRVQTLVQFAALFIHKQTNIQTNRYLFTNRQIYTQTDIHKRTEKYTDKQIFIHKQTNIHPNRYPYIYILHYNINKYVHGYAYIQI